MFDRLCTSALLLLFSWTETERVVSSDLVFESGSLLTDGEFWKVTEGH